MFLSSSSNEPLTLDQVYSSCLDSLGIGHALWDPELNDTGEVHFGDVGFVQDGSFMEVLSLKLSEAVSKALAQPPGPGVPGEVLAGRRPIPTGRGRTLGSLIVS